MEYDVVIVGAGIAGCTAATLYGRAGLRVAVLEKHRSPATFKALCGHFILGGTREMLRRNGFWDPIVAEGGFAAGIANWSQGAWALPPDDAPHPVSLRRERLDPLLRRIAAGTPGVELMPGQPVAGLLTRDGRAVGVRTRDGAGYRGRLVVAADGYRSPLAAAAGIAEDTAPNNRFGMWAYYRGVVDRGPAANLVWRLDPDVAIVVRTDDDLTMLVAFPTKRHLPEFRADGVAALERYIGRLPDAPDLSDAERVSRLVGMTDHPCVRRDPAPVPGLFLVGDAAVTGDPAPAVGCGWAFRAAEWLVESTVPALRGETSMPAAATAYRRRLRFILAHDKPARQAALARPANAIERTVVAATRVDAELNRRAYLYSQRAEPPSHLLNPVSVGRAVLIRAGLLPPAREIDNHKHFATRSAG